LFIVGVDLGQTQDPTAICVVEQREHPPGTGPRLEREYHLRYLARPPLGTRYPDIVAGVLALLDTPPLSRSIPLVVDKTGVGAAVVDLFTAAGVRPHAVTITGGDTATIEDPYDMRVPKRELASTLVALYQCHRLKVAKDLALAETLVTELLNFKVKINIATGHESFEAWRESIHDDLVLCAALACWYGESGPALPFAWLRNDPSFVAQVNGTAPAPVVRETPEETRARRMAARGLVMPLEDLERPHRYGEPVPSPWTPDRW
jgi:hypothetical protein